MPHLHCYRVSWRSFRSLPHCTQPNQPLDFTLSPGCQDKGGLASILLHPFFAPTHPFFMGRQGGGIFFRQAAHPFGPILAEIQAWEMKMTFSVRCQRTSRPCPRGSSNPRDAKATSMMLMLKKNLKKCTLSDGTRPSLVPFRKVLSRTLFGPWALRGNT